MKCSIITVFILLSGIWLAQPIPVQATSGATSLVFQRATTATSATPNVRICTMTQTKGMVKELGETGDKMQTLICDTILGYYLGKKLTVNITGSSYFHFEVDQDTLFNHDGHATNALKILSGTAWGEAIR